MIFLSSAQQSAVRVVAGCCCCLACGVTVLSMFCAHAQQKLIVTCTYMQCGFVWGAGAEDGTALEMAFSRKKIEERKAWLRGFLPGTYLDHTASDISYTDFVNKVRGCVCLSSDCSIKSLCFNRHWSSYVPYVCRSVCGAQRLHTHPSSSCDC